MVSYLTFGASSERELGDAHLIGVGIGMNRVEQLHEYVEHSRNESQPCLDGCRQPVPNSLHITDDGDH